MADRVAVLNEGDLKQLGSPSEILNSPTTVEVAQFVGDPPMNVLEARVGSDGGELSLDLGGFRVPASDKIRQLVSSPLSANDQGIRDTVMIGFRPGDIVIHQTQVEAPALPTELYSAETLHRKTVLSLSFGSELIKVNTPTDFQGKVGDKIWIDLPMEKAFVFDVQTGLALTN